MRKTLQLVTITIKRGEALRSITLNVITPLLARINFRKPFTRDSPISPGSMDFSLPFCPRGPCTVLHAQSTRMAVGSKVGEVA